MASRADPTRVVDEVVAACRQVLGRADQFVPLHEPCFRGREWEYVKDCLDTGWVSSVGAYVDRFETDLAEATGCAHAVATSTGTAALHIGLLLVGVTRDDEVLVPALSFVATANAVAYAGAIPHFLDCDEVTLGVDPDALERHLAETAELRADGCYNRRTGRRIGALVAVHMYGHPCRIEALATLATRYRLPLVEDAAESLGSWFRGRHTGRWGRVAALSFNGNKTLTTGGGGAVLTEDAALAARAKHLTTTAKVPHRWAYRHDAVGYNYRLPNLNAALGCAQLEQLPAFLDSKRRLAARYIEAFADLAGVRFVVEPPECRSNYWLCSLLLDDDLAGARDRLLETTNDGGIMTRPAWDLLSELPMYADTPRAALPVSARVARGLVNLPSSPGLCLQ
jgi:perosamine synthetase